MPSSYKYSDNNLYNKIDNLFNEICRGNKEFLSDIKKDKECIISIQQGKDLQSKAYYKGKQINLWGNINDYFIYENGRYLQNVKSISYSDLFLYRKEVAKYLCDVEVELSNNSENISIYEYKKYVSNEGKGFPGYNNFLEKKGTKKEWEKYDCDIRLSKLFADMYNELSILKGVSERTIFFVDMQMLNDKLAVVIWQSFRNPLKIEYEDSIIFDYFFENIILSLEEKLNSKINRIFWLVKGDLEYFNVKTLSNGEKVVVIY